MIAYTSRPMTDETIILAEKHRKVIQLQGMSLLSRVIKMFRTKMLVKRLQSLIYNNIDYVPAKTEACVNDFITFLSNPTIRVNNSIQVRKSYDDSLTFQSLVYSQAITYILLLIFY